MPLLTVLIPAYKPEYLAEVFEGLQRQSLRDFEVVLSDDSPDDGIARGLRDGRFGAAAQAIAPTVLRGPKSGRLNHRALLDHWAGRTPFVHLHLDDDLLYPDFYRRHLEVHASGRYALTASRRWMSDASGRPACSLVQPADIAHDRRRVVPVDAPTLFASMLPSCGNWVGEFTNMVLSADAARAWPRPPGHGLNYYGWMDVGLLLSAVQVAPIGLIQEHLSVFRRHPQQTTHNPHTHSGRVGAIAWAVYALQAWREGRIDDVTAVASIGRTVQQCLQRFGDADGTMREFFDLVQHQGTSLDRLYDAVAGFWHELLASDRSTRADPAPGTPARDAVPA